MKYLILILTFLCINLSVSAQGTSGEDAKFEYRSLIDMPTAGILEKGFVGITTDIMSYGTLIARMEVGVFENVSFGISYGATNMIGSGDPDWYELPGVNIKFRLFKEALLFPGLAVGFESQGKGVYFDSSSRYAIKSPGFYASASKNFALLGYMSLHGTANYSLENEDGDSFINLTVGMEKTIGSSVSLLLEYDFAFNDNTTNYYGSGDGYLNAGIRVTVGEGFTLGMDFRDLLRNKQWSPDGADRALKIEYIKSIF